MTNINELLERLEENASKDLLLGETVRRATTRKAAQVIREQQAKIDLAVSALEWALENLYSLVDPAEATRARATLAKLKEKV